MLIRYYSSTFKSLVQLLTLIFLFCHPKLCFIVFSILVYIIRHQYLTVCSTHLRTLISVSSSISAQPLAEQFGIPINLLQNLPWTTSATPKPYSTLTPQFHTWSLPTATTPWYPLILAGVSCLFQLPVLSNVTPGQLKYINYLHCLPIHSPSLNCT